MLFSIYASYRWVRSKNYVLKMTTFIISASFLSTIMPEFWILNLFIWPLSLLSFPFSMIVNQSHSYTPIIGYSIRFLTTEIAYIPFTGSRYIYIFSFFFLVNSLSTILGYHIDKLLLTESLKQKLFDFFFRSGILSLLGCYLVLFVYYFALGVTTGYQVNHYLNDNTLWFTIANILYLFSMYFFWIPAVISTTIYAVYK